MTTTFGTYRVPEVNLEILRDRLAKLAKKCAKLGLEPITLTEGERELQKYKVSTAWGDVVERVRVWVHVTLSGAEPKLNGWRFVATLAPTDEGTIIAAVPGEAVPEKYRNTDLRCDHCRTLRRRSEVFVVVNDDGRDAQVGSNCLRDFLGHGDPHAIASYAQELAAFAVTLSGPFDDGEGWGGPRGDDTLSLDGFLALTSAVIKLVGWRSRTKAREFGGSATVDDVLTVLCGGPDARRRWIEKHGEPVVTDEDRALAEAAIEWGRTVEPKGDDDYLHNVRVIARTGVATQRTFGIAASILGSYRRTLEKEAERKEWRKSQHFGTPKKREVFTLTVYGETHSSSDWGPVTLYKMKDAAGNVAMWWSSSAALKVGVTYRLKATVKEHREYEGIKQTMLSRCAVVEEVESAA